MAVGILTASSVALGSFPILRESAARESNVLSQRLETTVMLGDLALHQLPDEAWAQALLEIRTKSGVTTVTAYDAAGRPGPSETGAPDIPFLQACDPKLLESGRATLRGPFKTANGVWVQTACGPLHDAAASGNRALVAVQTAGFIVPLATSEFRTRTLLLLLGSIAGILAMTGVRTVIGPLAQVSEAARRIGSGVRNVHVEPTGPEELQQLAIAINSLARGVEAREDEIHGRMALVAELTGTVAHEVRNPLQSLTLLCSLARTAEDAQEREQYLAQIDQEVRSLEGVVQALLRDSGGVRLSVGPTNLRNLVTSAVDLARLQAAAKSVLLTSSITLTLDHAQVDGSMLRRSLENLLLNAIAWAGTHKGGQVAIEVSSTPTTLQIVVDDDGPGVPADQREEIFKAFVSHRPGGTGLGLSLVKHVMTAHGGRIECLDSPLGGARFRATLPLDRADHV